MEWSMEALIFYCEACLVRVIGPISSNKHVNNILQSKYYSMKKVLEMILLSLICMKCTAQSTIKHWSLQQCVAYAREHNLSLQQADADIKAAKYDKLAAKGQLLPSLNAGVSQNYSIGLSVDPITNVKKDETSRSNSFGLNANWTLFNGFYILHGIKKANIDLLTSRYQKEKMENDLTIHIMNAYLQILLNKELLKLAKEQLRLSEQQVAILKEQLNVGEKAPSDLVDVESQRATDRQQVVQSENDLIKARLSLVQYLQLKDTDQFRIETDTSFIPDTAILSRDMEAIYQKALHILPDIKLRRTELKSAEQYRKMTEHNFLPSLSFSANAGTDYSDRYIINNEKVPFSRQFHDNLGYYFSFSLNIPIFNNFYASTTYKKAKLEVIKAKDQLEQEQYDLWQAIQTIYSNARLSLRSYEVGKQSYAAQKAAFDYAGERYKSGLITSYDYELARNKMITAASQLIQYKYEYRYSLLLLRFYFTNQIK